MHINKLCVALFSTQFLIAGCASRGDRMGDWPLMWPTMHARLHVFSPEGQEIPPFNDLFYLRITGYSFSSDGIGIIPGERQVSYACPLPEGALVISDYIPTVTFRFEAGKDYDLRCSEGHPVITERIKAR